MLYIIFYNFLNLPQTITKSGSSLTYYYTATGEKVCKQVGAVKRYYAGGFEYDNSKNLVLIHHPEGVVEKSGSAFNYEYFIKDHLGNTRIAFRPNGGSKTLTQRVVYYPFGHTAEQENSNSNQYKYNGKELQAGLDWYDYGARFYDAQIGRWHVMDPLMEKYYEWSPYNYVSNNPLLYFDYMGLEGKKYYKRFPKTTQQEKRFIYDNPFKAKKIRRNANTAHAKTIEYFGPYSSGIGHNDAADAFRHVLWQALNTQSVGKRKTKQYGDAHESETPKERENEKKMDIHNNSIGILIGVNNPDASIENIITMIFNKFESGDLLVIDSKTGELVLAPKKPKTIKSPPKLEQQLKEEIKKKKDDDEKNKLR